MNSLGSLWMPQQHLLSTKNITRFLLARQSIGQL